MMNTIEIWKQRPPLPLLLVVFLILSSCAEQHPLPRHGTPVPVERQKTPPRPERLEVPAPNPAPKQPPPTVKSGPAHSLYAKANEALAVGHPDQAEMLLERALRIEPRNAVYRHLLGQSKYAQGDFAQAVQFCRKSESLAGNNSQLRQANSNLLHQASSRLGAPNQVEQSSR